jgi:FkbM family methyltransferase
MTPLSRIARSRNWYDPGYGYDEVIVRDGYGIKDLSMQYPIDYFIDIGSNDGMTSVWFNLFYPESSIIAIEPCLSTFERMRGNTQHIKKIVRLDAAFGDGEPLYIQSDEGTGSMMMSKVPKGNPVESATLRAIFASVPAGSSYYLKVDCEGSEKFLLHPDNVDWLKNADFIAIEYHHYGCGVSMAEEEAIQRIVAQEHVLTFHTSNPTHTCILARHKKFQT